VGFYKKTILLSNQSNYNEGMAILNIEQTNAGIFASIKIFDIAKRDNFVLGISVDGKQVLKQNIMFLNSNIFNFKLSDSFNINGRIGCVLVEINNNVVKPLLWGTNGSYAQYKEDIINVIKCDGNNDSKSVNEYLKDEVNIAKKEMQEKQQNIDNKEKLFETSDDEIEEMIDKELKDEFYLLVKDQIDVLFDKFPTLDILSKKIPNSKWVKIDYENNGNAYILGLIYKDDIVEYICYGVPSNFDNLPPNQLKAYSQWMFIDELNEGYWVMFQDSKTGDNIIIDDLQSNESL